MTSVTTLGWKLPCILPGWDFTPLPCYILLWSALYYGCSQSQIRWERVLLHLNTKRAIRLADHNLKCICVFFRRAVTSAVWCLRCLTWYGPPSFWSGGRGGGLSSHTSGEHWMHPLNLWRSHGLSSGWEKLNVGFLPSISSVISFMVFTLFALSVLAGSQALQSRNRMWGILLPSMAKACIQVAGQPAHLYPLSLLCLPGHAHLLWAAGQSAVSVFHMSSIHE